VTNEDSKQNPQLTAAKSQITHNLMEVILLLKAELTRMLMSVVQSEKLANASSWAEHDMFTANITN
jgi:hypothetical protein